MSQEMLRWAAAGLTLLLSVWMAGFSIYLRSKGVEVAALTQKQSNPVQRALIAGALMFDIYLVLRAPLPSLDQFVGAQPAPAPWFAFALLIAGAVLIAASQSGMGRSWRVGVPQEKAHVDTLVTGGLHGVSRNPVYLGVMIFLFGALAAAPGPLSFGAVIISYIGLTLIIRQEERYLSDRFGKRYEDYKRRVRRWI